MKRRYTYRELTMILGVFVALIVALTIWAAQKRSIPTSSKVEVTTEMVSSAVTEFISKTIRTVKL